MYSLKFNTSTATVGRINRNGIVTFGKICHLSPARTALICCSGRKVLISVFRKPASGETYSRGLTEKKTAGDFNLLANIGSLIAKSPSIELVLIFIMYLFLSSKSLSLLRHLGRCINSSYINALPEPSAQRRRTKGEPQSCIWYYYLKKSNLWSQHV